MNEMNSESQDPTVDTLADAAAPAPKRRRTRKAEVAADVVALPEASLAVVPQEEVAAPVPAKPRRARKTAPAAAPADAELVAVVAEPVAATVAAAADAPQDEAAPAAPAKRAPRSRKRVLEAPVAEVVPVAEILVPPPRPEPQERAAGTEPETIAAAEAAAPAGSAESAGTAELDEAAGSASGQDAGLPTGERRRDRPRRRGRRGDAAEGTGDDAGERAGDGPPDAAVQRGARPPRSAPVQAVFTLGDVDEGAEANDSVVDMGGPQLIQVDAGTRFTDVVTGSYDSEGEAVAEEDLGKRVLRPEPEAPKLHKVLAQSGIGSRRDMEQLIEQGQVMVNGEVAHVGMRIARGDQIKIAGKPIKVRIAPMPARVVAYHKPVGEVVTHHDPEGRPTVFRHLPRLANGKWLSVGRLDINTEGLLLFTNSGDLANQLMHPRFGVEREYAVRVLGTLDEAARQKLLTGVDIEGQSAAFKSIEDGGGEGANHWYRVVITEGRNREVRKLFDSVGMAVSRLIRIRYGTVVLPRGLKRGVWLELGDEDVRQIRRLAGNDQGLRPDRPERGDRGERVERGAERGERADRPDKGKGRGAQHGGGMGKGAQQGQGPGQGPLGRGPNQGPGANKQRGKGPGKFGGGGQPDAPLERERREPREARGEDDDDIPMHIPNPLEQTFDRRFATGSKRIVSGFGRPMEDSGAGQGQGQRRKGEPKQPDPMQTSVGYIGADAYFTRPGGQGKNRGGRRR